MAEVARDALLFRAAPSALGALPLAQVRETMRPLALEVVAGAPAAVAGVAVVRGAPAPVLDVRRLLGSPRGPAEAATRWIAVVAGARLVVLAVDGVLGVRRLPEALAATTPPLFGAVARDAIEELGALDGELLVVLRASRLLDEAAWRALDAAAEAPRGS